MVAVKGRSGTGAGSRKTQFKPGVSGNPKGNALDRHSTASMAHKLDMVMRRKVNISEFDHVPIGTKSPTKSVKDIMAESLIRKAIQGDVQAFKEIVERVDGKVADNLNVTGDGYEALLEKLSKETTNGRNRKNSKKAD